MQGDIDPKHTSRSTSKWLKAAKKQKNKTELKKGVLFLYLIFFVLGQGNVHTVTVCDYLSTSEECCTVFSDAKAQTQSRA